MTDLIWDIMSDGATIVTPDTLLPAGALLDLYGEDIRSRVYVTQDPVLGEMMMRPDFTVPIMQVHIDGGIEPARYAYRGKVWRKQAAQSTRPREYGQIGIEIFDNTNAGLADAEVFDRVMRSLAATGIDETRVVTGDVGLLCAAVASLQTSDLRRKALIRHLWRPAQFNALLARFAGETDTPPGRDALRKEGLGHIVENAGPEIGLRSVRDVCARVERLVADRDEAAIPSAQVTALRKLQSVDIRLSEASNALNPISVGPAVAG